MTDINFGIILSIIGISTVFTFLSFIAFVVFVMKKSSKKKEILITISDKSESNLETLEKTAAIAGAYLFITNKRSSLASVDKNSSNINYYNWQNNKEILK